MAIMRFSRVCLLAATSLVLVGCGNSTSRSEETRFANDGPTTFTECIDKFQMQGEVWGDKAMQASFVYDISSTDLADADKFRKRISQDGEQHTIAMHNGDGGEAALADFLKRDPKGDTEIFVANGVTLIRVNDVSSDTFDEALRVGCERATGDSVVRQVSFSQGKN